MSQAPVLLEQLLEPIGEPGFLNDCFGRRPAVLAHENPDLLQGLFDLDDLEAYLFTARPKAGEVLLVLQGKSAPAEELRLLEPGPEYSLQAVYRALGNGYTVVLNSVHERWPAVHELVVDIEDRFLSAAQTNVYVTGRQSQGFNVHTDTHDVFVLQTYGAKNWVVYDKPASGSNATHGELLYELELRQGDVLYLPEGFPHAAATSGDYSIHLALGVHRYTWKHLLADLAEHVARTDSRWHQPVPLSLLRGTDLPPRIGEIEDRLRDSLIAMKDLSPVLKGHVRRLQGPGRRVNPPPSGYARSVHGLGKIAPDTRIERRPGIGCVVRRTGTQAEMSFMSDTIRVPARAEPALRFIAANRVFRVADLPGEFSDDSRVTLVRRFVREGLLQISENQ